MILSVTAAGDCVRSTRLRYMRWRRFGLIVLGSVGAAAMALCISHLCNGVAHAALWGDPRGTNVLFLGLDGPKPGIKEVGPDVLMVLHIGAPHQPLRVVSITRDTRALIVDGRLGLRKINAGFAVGGVSLTRQLVTDFTGIPIDQYVVVDFDGFRRTIDAVGGVEMSISEGMRHTDSAGTTAISLDPGARVLDGREALDFVRWRHGDIDRIGRQQAFGRAVLRRLAGKGDVRATGELIEGLSRAVRTDLTSAQLGWLVRMACGGSTTVVFSTIAGRHAVSGDWLYVSTEAEKAKALAGVRPAPMASGLQVAELSAEELVFRAGDARRRGLIPEATMCLKEYVRRAPEGHGACEAALTLASLLVAQDDVPCALRELTASCSGLKAADAARLWETIGHLHLAQYELDRAMDSWRRAVALEPTDIGKAQVVARVLSTFDAVRKPELTALALQSWPQGKLPRDLSLLLRGLEASRSGDAAEGEEFLCDLVHQSPRSLFAPEAMVCLGDLARRSGDPARACALYAEARRAYPLHRGTCARSLLHSAFTHSAQEKPLDALLCLYRLLDDYQDLPEVCAAAREHANVVEGRVLASCDSGGAQWQDKVRRQLLGAAGTRAGGARARVLLGDMVLQGGDAHAALRLYAEAADLACGTGDPAGRALLHAAYAHVALKRPALAAEACRSALGHETLSEGLSRQLWQFMTYTSGIVSRSI